MFRRSLGLSLACAASVAACSVLNSPEELKPVNDGSGATAGTAGSRSSGGTSSIGDGGTGEPLGGGGASAGGCGDCTEGGAPPIGRMCTSSEDECGSTAPICDAADGECRACATNAECEAELGKPHCVTSGAAQGRCAECLDDDECAGRTPVCGNTGSCRACSADTECASGACAPNGACLDPTKVVYALAQTGVSSATCGTQDEPCRELGVAVTRLTAERSTLVMVKTPKAFDSGAATFPAIKGLRVVGNGVTVKPVDAGTVFIIPAGAEVAIDNVIIRGVTADDSTAIQCTGGALALTNSSLLSNLSGVSATDCNVVLAQNSFKSNNVPIKYSAAAVKLACGAGCTRTASILRNRFEDNSIALNAWEMADVNVENNLFLRNGADGYTRVLELRSLKVHFAYNTLVENFNGCTYVGIVACDENCANVANISYNNFPGQDCQDQVWYGGTLTYNLTEVAFPGATNKVGDPLFVDAANGDYTPGPGSPAIDGGNPDDAPPFDFLGTKRPEGDAPDIGAIESK